MFKSSAWWQSKQKWNLLAFFLHLRQSESFLASRSSTQSLYSWRWSDTRLSRCPSSLWLSEWRVLAQVPPLELDRRTQSPRQGPQVQRDWATGRNTLCRTTSYFQSDPLYCCSWLRCWLRSLWRHRWFWWNKRLGCRFHRGHLKKNHTHTKSDEQSDWCRFLLHWFVPKQ